MRYLGIQHEMYEWGVYYMKKLLLTAVLLAVSASAAWAQGITAADSVKQAVAGYPEGQAKIRAYEGAGHDLKGAYSGYRPKLDIYGNVGRYNLHGDGYDDRAFYDMDDHGYDGVQVILTQPLYDGGQTIAAVKKYKLAQSMRYYDMLSTMELVGSAAFRSHQDVVRYRTLVALAGDNLTRHEEILAKVKKRTAAGVDSSVNYDTAMGRVALARVNLTTQEANLHDAVTQYMRVTGQAAPAEMQDSAVTAELPALPEEAEKMARQGNFQLISYGQNARSMEYAVKEQRSKMRPRLDLRGAQYVTNNDDGTAGRKDKAFVELVLRWNLYNGGLDRENVAKAISQYQESKEMYKKIERDVIQSVLISQNEIASINKQLPELECHKNAADITRSAYAKQFEAGRRSLFDLLDAENEYFQACMSYTNAQFNIKNMKADYLASTGLLLKDLGVEVNVKAPAGAAVNIDEVVSMLSEGSSK